MTNQNPALSTMPQTSDTSGVIQSWFYNNYETIRAALQSQAVPSAGEVEKVRSALQDARNELWDTWHSHMTDAEFKGHPTIDGLDKALATLDAWGK